MKLSEHFTLEELTHSGAAERRGINNTPDDTVLQSLKTLCAGFLEPLREKIHAPINILSGYRSPEVNKIVGGASNSQHTKGEAVDIMVPAMSIESLFVLIQNNFAFDQLIQEGTWVHVSFVETGRRQQALRAYRNAEGKVSYAAAR